MATQIYSTPTTSITSLPIRTAARSQDAQTILAGGIYGFLLRECLELSERHRIAVEKRWRLPSSIQQLLGYRSALELPSRYLLKQWETAWLQHERLDQLTDDEFFDWQIYGKVYDERERRWIHEHVHPRPPEITNPYTSIEQEIGERFGAVKGIPGLYLDENYLRLTTFRPCSLIVPCRVNGIIRALQIYPRANKSDFYWYSSPHAKGGASARASIHVTNESRAEAEGKAVIVSHTIEADALAWTKYKCVIACNGLSAGRVARELRVLLPYLKRVALPSRLENLARALRERGYTVRTFDEGREAHE